MTAAHLPFFVFGRVLTGLHWTRRVKYMPTTLALLTNFSTVVQEGIRFLTGEVSNFEPHFLTVTTTSHPKLPPVDT
jgi:hypothetical protein